MTCYTCVVLVRYNPLTDSRDQGIPGNYYTRYAEKQYIAYFTDKHGFLERQDDGVEGGGL